MSTRNAERAASSPGRTKPTRAQRRAAARAQPRPPVRRQRRLPISTLVGGFVTIAIVAAILAYAVVRGTNTTSASSGGLTDPNALNPRTSLLSTGAAAPNFVLKNSNGTSYHLAAQRGHPVLLEFFAVWCPVCQGEAPIMKQLTSTYASKGVRVWSILANPYGRNYEDSGQTDLRLANNGDLAWFAQNFGVHHPQLIDPKFKVVNEYGVGAYPGLYVVNSKGVISYAAEGHRVTARWPRRSIRRFPAS